MRPVVASSFVLLLRCCVLRAEFVAVATDDATHPPIAAAAAAAGSRPVCASAREETQLTIAAGGSDSCAVVYDGGRVVCWGANVAAVIVPPAAQADQDAVVLGHGATAACAFAAGRATCWGLDLNASAGPGVLCNDDGTVTSSVAFAPRAVAQGNYPTLDSPTTLSPTCAVVDGGVTCVARRCGLYACRVGNVPSRPCGLAPVPPEAEDNQALVVAADTFACSLSLDGDVTCWPLWNDTTGRRQQHGHASIAAFSAPGSQDEMGHHFSDYSRSGACELALPGPHAVAPPTAAQVGQRFLSAGGNYVCALSRGGDVHCWGPSGPHVPTWARSGAIALAAGPAYTCTISHHRGAVRCWAQAASAFSKAKDAFLAGAPEHYLFSPVFTPEGVASGQVAVSAAAQHACSLDAHGNVTCWGSTAGAVVPEMLTGAVRLPCLPRDAAQLPPPAPIEARCTERALRPFPAHDAIGARLASLSVADEVQCRVACCKDAACAGYSLVTQLLPEARGGDAAAPLVPCVLLSRVDRLVPSNIMSAGVRPGNMPAGAAL